MRRREGREEREWRGRWKERGREEGKGRREMGGVGGKEGELRRKRGREKVKNRWRRGRRGGGGRVPGPITARNSENTAWSLPSRPGPGWSFSLDTGRHARLLPPPVRREASGIQKPG